MRVLCAPDLHCWWTTYEKYPGNKIPSRLQEWRNVTEYMCELAKSYQCELALFPGDYFIESTPHPQAVNEVIKLFSKLESLGVKVIGIKGNHDDTGVEQTSFVDVISNINLDWGITKPTRIEFKDIEIICLPFMKNAEIVPGGSIKDCSDALTEIILQFRLESQMEKSIVLAHYGTDMSVFANGWIPKKQVEPVLQISKLMDLDVEAYVLGHIHKPQDIIQNDPIVFHTGVLTYGKSDEGQYPARVTILDTETWEKTEELLPVTPITNVVFSREAMEDFDSYAWMEEIPQIGGHIVTVNYDISEAKLRFVNNQKIIDALNLAGAYFIEGIHPHVIKQTRQRNASITERTDEVESFKKWYDEVGEDPDLKDKVTVLFKEVLEETR